MAITGWQLFGVLWTGSGSNVGNLGMVGCLGVLVIGYLIMTCTWTSKRLLRGLEEVRINFLQVILTNPKL